MLYRISPIPIESFPFSLPPIHHDNISFPFHSSAIAIPSTCSTFPVPIYKCFQVALRVRRRRDRSVFSTHISTRPVDRTQHQITVSACCSRLRHSNAHEKRYVAITVPMAFPREWDCHRLFPLQCSAHLYSAVRFCSEILTIKQAPDNTVLQTANVIFFGYNFDSLRFDRATTIRRPTLRPPAGLPALRPK